jgi:hypothetical protein
MSLAGPRCGLANYHIPESPDVGQAQFRPGTIVFEAPHGLLVICGVARGDGTSLPALVHHEGTFRTLTFRLR